MLARSRVVAALWAASLANGCAAHVAFEPAPTASAPLEVRADYYATHALRKAERGELSVRTRLFDARPTISRTHATMENGASIKDVADLTPLIDETSATRKSIDAAVDARVRGDALVIAGASVAGAGLAAGAGLLALAIGIVPGQGEKPAPGLSPLMLGGAGAFIGGGLLGGALIAVGTWFVADEEDHTSRAFGTFNDDLRARLALPVAPAAPREQAPAPPSAPEEPVSPP